MLSAVASETKFEAILYMEVTGPFPLWRHYTCTSLMFFVVVVYCFVVVFWGFFPFNVEQEIVHRLLLWIYLISLLNYNNCMFKLGM